MPNHVINEIVFTDLTLQQRVAILSKCLNDEGRIDFSVLLPLPINYWPSSVAKRHEDTFPGTHLDAAIKDWGTKWNAYQSKIEERPDGSLVLLFETAWRPPYGWLIAIFNTFKVGFKHTWLDEGHPPARVGVFDYAEIAKDFGEPWREIEADEVTTRRMRKILFGVEEFEEEDELAEAAQ